MEPTTPARNGSPGFEIIDENIGENEIDGSSASSYLPTGSEDSISVPPSPSPYSKQNLPPVPSSASTPGNPSWTPTSDV